jgi:hypothetical protein
MARLVYLVPRISALMKAPVGAFRKRATNAMYSGVGDVSAIDP